MVFSYESSSQNTNSRAAWAWAREPRERNTQQIYIDNDVLFVLRLSLIESCCITPSPKASFGCRGTRAKNARILERNDDSHVAINELIPTTEENQGISDEGT